jgi:nucleoside-diphosphate-sugar epimerase
MKSVLITGGGGFIGFHLAKHLFDQGYDITILENFARGKRDDEFEKFLEEGKAKLIEGDITVAETFEKLGEYDYIYHLAMINGTENFYKIPDKVLKVGIVGTLNVLDWFVKQKKGKLLFSSSSEAYAGALKILGDNFPLPTPENVPLVIEDPSNVRWSYGGSKMLSEIAIHSYAQAYDMKNFCIIRYHNIYGPRMGFEHVIPQFIERTIKDDGDFKIFGGQETRTFCYVEDGVEATRLVMESDETNGKTIHIGRDDDEIKIIDLAKNLFEIAEVERKFDVRPAPDGSVMRRCPNIEKLKGLGFSPKVDLKEGLKKSYDWYKEKIISKNLLKNFYNA